MTDPEDDQIDTEPADIPTTSAPPEPPEGQD